MSSLVGPLHPLRSGDGGGGCGGEGRTRRVSAGEAEVVPSEKGPPVPGGSPPPRSRPLSSVRFRSIIVRQLPWATAR